MKRDYTQLPRGGHTFKWVDHELYNTWQQMKNRCYYKKHNQYKDWGGRGIRVCKAWRYNFEQFLLDMGERPTKEHSIDRINNNKNYKPSNCRWATKQEQAENKRVYSTNKTGYSGITHTPSGGFQVRVKNGKIILGVFGTLDEARKAQKLNVKQHKPRLSNTSGLKGVNLDKTSGLYNVRRVIDGVRTYLGSTSTLDEAKLLYDSGIKRDVKNVNTSGISGVTKMKDGKFRVRKTINGVRLSLGVCNTLDEAKRILDAN